MLSLLPGWMERAHVDYHLMAATFKTARLDGRIRDGRGSRVYVIDGAGMFCVTTLEKVLVDSAAPVVGALAGIDMCGAATLDGMLVCIRRACALIRASIDKYALLFVYGLGQYVPVPAARTAGAVLSYVTCVELLMNVGREGNVGVVVCNAVREQQQRVVYVGHVLNDDSGARCAMAGSAEVVLVRENGESVLERKFFDPV